MFGGQVIREGHASIRVEQNNIERLTSTWCDPRKPHPPQPCSIMSRVVGLGWYLSLSIYLYLSIYLSIYLPIYLSLLIYLPISMYLYFFMSLLYLYIYQSKCQYEYIQYHQSSVFFYLSILLSIYQFFWSIFIYILSLSIIYLFIHLFIYLYWSIHLFSL